MISQQSWSNVTAKRTPRYSWGYAAEIEERLTASECAVLEYIARLPLIWVEALQQLFGYADGSDVYRRISRLRSLKLVGTIQPSLQPGHSPRLMYLTDLGLAVLALFWQVEITDLVRYLKLRADDLFGRLPSLPHLIASYELLAALAASGTGWPDLLVWTRPWRCRFYRPTAKAPVAVQVPAYAVLAWNDAGFNFFLFPDLGTYPLRIYRPMLNHLLVLRRVNEGRLAPLLIATTHPGRASKWRDLLRETAQFQGDYRLKAWVTMWSSLQTALEPFVSNGPMAPRSKLPAWSPRHLETLKPRRRTQRIPCFVGDGLAGLR